MVYRNLGLHDYKTHHWKKIQAFNKVRCWNNKTTARPECQPAHGDHQPPTSASRWVTLSGCWNPASLQLTRNIQIFTKTGTEIYCVWNSSWLVFCWFCFSIRFFRFFIFFKFFLTFLSSTRPWPASYVSIFNIARRQPTSKECSGDKIQDVKHRSSDTAGRKLSDSVW